MGNTVRKVSVMFLAILLTFSSSIATFAAEASGKDEVGSYNYFWEIGTSWSYDSDYCYAQVEDSFEAGIEIDGYGYNVEGRFYFHEWADCSQGLIAKAHSWIGFDGVHATFSVSSYDGWVTNTYEVSN